MKIELKDWKKYRQQIRIYNDLMWKRFAEMQKEHFEQINKQQARINVEAVKAGRLARSIWSPFMPPICMLKQASVEGCLDWVAEGRPTIAKKLKVKHD